jgi:DNA-binding LacI/PurR family transcriptional regulator
MPRKDTTRTQTDIGLGGVVEVALSAGGVAEAAGGPQKPVSLRDVAKLANVSVATVSMVLNENPRISRATQMRVRRLIDQLRYRPNRLAQSLSSRYTNMVAVLVPALRHAFADVYFGEILSGIADRAGKLGQKIMLESAKPEFVKEGRHVELFERRYVDGVLLLGFNDRHGFVAELAGRGYPMVSVNNAFRSWRTGHVVCDYRSGAAQIMNYLLQLGHKNIGLIHAEPETQTQRDIIEVYEARMRAAGLACDASWREDGRFTEQGGAAAAAALLGRHPEMTAIFGGNDKMAVGAIHYLNQRGVRIPGDISVTGFDDIRHTAFVTPSLTTVHVPLYEAGALACERLVERIHGRAEEVGETLATHLVLRDSTGIVPVRD